MGFLKGLSLTLCLVVPLAVTSGCRSLRVPDATIQSSDDWLTEGGAPERVFARDVRWSLPLEEAWTYNAGAGFGPGSPLLLNKAVLVATRKGELHAIDIETGKGLGVISAGESIEGSPVAAPNGIVYIPVAWGRRGLAAYDLMRGEIVWRDRRVPVNAGLLLADGRLIAADVESRVLGYEAVDGTLLWDRVLSDRALIHATPVQLDSTSFLVADDAGMVSALDLDSGDLLWEVSVERPVYATPAAKDGVVYIPTTRGALIALDAHAGSEVFLFEVENKEVRFTPPAVGDDIIVVGASDGEVRALDTQGNLIWSFPGGEAIAGAPLIASDHVYVGDMANVLRALDLETGKILWEKKLGGRIKSAMAARDAGLVVLAEPRNVHLFRPASPHASSD